MKKYLLFLTFAFLFGEYSFAAYSGTPKTPSKVDGCYQIGSAEELYGFAELLNTKNENGAYVINETCAKLTADIVVNKNVINQIQPGIRFYEFYKWTPIKYFRGVFDGQGHTISGLFMYDELYFDNAGLIANIKGFSKDKPTIIKNLGIIDSHFLIRRKIGSIAGTADNVVIEKCFADNMIRGEREIGGFVGSTQGVNVISESYNKSDIEAISIDFGEKRYVGGLIGLSSQGTTTIKNSYNIGNIYAFRDFGGLVGFAGLSNSTVIIENSYSVNPVNLKLLGEYDKSSSNAFISNSYYLSDSANVDAYAKTKQEFIDGTVAVSLHYGLDGQIWGQNIGIDTTPLFTGMIQNYTKPIKISKINLHTFDGDTARYPTQYVEGMSIQLPIPIRKNHIFVGWYTNSQFTGEKIYSVIHSDSGDKEFFAKWWGKPAFKDNCYELASAGDLYVFAGLVNGSLGDTAQGKLCGKLIADIVLNDDSSSKTNWTPMNNFMGLFDGQGHTISGLYYDFSEGNYVGLFAQTVQGIEGKPVIIQNLGLVNSYIDALWYVGGIVGYHTGELILKNVYNTGSMNAKHYSGGLLGFVNGKVTIINSYNAASNNEAGLVGGLLSNSSISIINSFNYGSHKTDIYSNPDFIGLKDSTNTVTIINSFGKSGNLENFANGSIAKALHDYNENGIDGSIWGQRVGIDLYPVHTGKIDTVKIASSSSSKATSSSSSPKASSSASTSSSAKSSSSGKSSSSKAKSSSSKKTSILSAIPVQETAKVYSQGRTIFVEQYNGLVTIFDLNGNLVRDAYSNGHTEIRLQRAGTYIVRIGAKSRRISLTTDH